ncbi:hypothetical protein J6590_076742 [Homalodisca vitripennis]|nr:hypothetical protein J6590_076742 [Homalodisca vitripennis]
MLYVVILVPLGTQFGTVVTLFVAGYLTAGPWGWPSIFYRTGLCGVLWAVAWLFLGANSPDTHPSISDSEREYIKAAFVSSSDQSSENGVTKGTIYKYWTVTPPSQTSDCFEANNTQLNF